MDTTTTDNALTDEDRKFITEIAAIVAAVPAAKQERFMDWILETCRCFVDMAEIDNAEAGGKTE